MVLYTKIHNKEVFKYNIEKTKTFSNQLDYSSNVG